MSVVRIVVFAALLCLAEGRRALGTLPDPETLTSLDISAAKFLAANFRHVRLPSLRTLTAEAAGPLVSTPWTIDLPTLETVDLGVAQALGIGRPMALRQASAEQRGP